MVVDKNNINEINQLVSNDIGLMSNIFGIKNKN